MSLLYFYILAISPIIMCSLFSKLATFVLDCIIVYALLKQGFSLELLTFGVG